jgi:CRISPR-associated protein Csb1
LRGYSLGESATNLLIALALFKVRRFLSTGLRLRTACDLQVVGDLIVTKPKGFGLPQENELLRECHALISKCSNEKLFTSPPVTEVKWEPKKKGERKTEEQEREEERD